MAELDEILCSLPSAPLRERRRLLEELDHMQCKHALSENEDHGPNYKAHDEPEHLRKHYDAGYWHARTGYGFQKSAAGRKGSKQHESYRRGYYHGNDDSGGMGECLVAEAKKSSVAFRALRPEDTLEPFNGLAVNAGDDKPTIIRFRFDKPRIKNDKPTKGDA